MSRTKESLSAHISIANIKIHTMKTAIRHTISGQKVRRSDVVRRLLMYMDESLLGNGTSTPFNDGKDWYKQANDFAWEMLDIFVEVRGQVFPSWEPVTAENRDLYLKKMCGVISALSPQVTWDQNKKLAVQYLTTGYASTTKDRIKKCIAIMQSKTDDEIFNSVSIRGLKTRAFYLNISRPDIVGAVTIDRHAIAASMQLPHSAEALDINKQSITPLQYEFFQSCYIDAAYQWSRNNPMHEPIKPHQLQAIVWVTYRIIRGLK